MTSADRIDPGEGLPDLVREKLDVLFVGINPSSYSAAQGHYFARKTNRFWPSFSRSILSLAAREALGVACLEPRHDRLLPDQGFGFTDAVKRPTPRASDLSPAEFAEGVAALIGKLEYFQPSMACFHGITAYRQVHRALTRAKSDPSLDHDDFGLHQSKVINVIDSKSLARDAGGKPGPAFPHPALGLQDIEIGRTRIFVVPNPSSANAHFTPADQVAWYDRLAACLEHFAVR
jgi:TDG/mug DNA glycosylase family protein